MAESALPKDPGFVTWATALVSQPSNPNLKGFRFWITRAMDFSQISLRLLSFMAFFRLATHFVASSLSLALRNLGLPLLPWSLNVSELSLKSRFENVYSFRS